MAGLFYKGGIMMYPILLFSVIAIAVILERIYIIFIKTKNIDENVIEEVTGLAAKGNVRKAVTILESDESSFRNYYMSILKENDRESMERAAVSVGDEILFGLNRRLAVLSVTASALPLMGLLGTVLGMITVFSSVAHAGDAADITLLAGGIWEALLTTAAGMAVAIPVMLMYHFFKRTIEKCAFRMSSKGNRIIESLHRGE